MNEYNTASEMTNVDEVNRHMNEIKSDNKKAGKKFVLLLLLCGIVGGIGGILLVDFSKAVPRMSQIFEEFMTANMGTIGIIIPAVMGGLTAIICFISMYDVKKNMKHISHFIAEDDEESLGRIEKKISYDMWMTNGVMVFNYFLFAAMIFADANFGEDRVPRISIYTIAVFIGFMIAILVVWQKLVDCTRLLNPEKKGSIYDFKFKKKWEESCDEGEKLIIYKSCYKVFQAVNMTCLILWTIFVFIGLSVGTGFLAVVAISVIWAVLVCTYYYYTMKYSKSK